MEATRIIAIRHGETAWNVDGRIQGHLDIPLNDVGREQAARLAQALAARAEAGDAIDACFSSDLARARETAEAVARATGAPLTLDSGLRERCFGELQGQSFTEIAARWPDEAERWRRRDPDWQPAGGESLLQFQERILQTVRRLSRDFHGQQIALFMHGGVLDVLYRAATGQALQAPRTWQIGNAAINRLLATPQGLTLVGWADTAHLQAEARDEY